MNDLIENKDYIQIPEIEEIAKKSCKEKFHVKNVKNYIHANILHMDCTITKVNI